MGGGVARFAFNPARRAPPACGRVTKGDGSNMKTFRMKKTKTHKKNLIKTREATMENDADFRLKTKVDGGDWIGSASPLRTDAPNAEMRDGAALLNGDMHFI
jgi:hypothetical protein